jgi:protein TonB
MFDRIVHKELPRRAARRAFYALLVSAVQGVLIGSALFASAHAGTRGLDELPTVEVRFVSGLRARPAPPRAARPPGMPASGRAASREARKAAKPAPSALVQPRQVTDEIRIPDPGEPAEELPEGGWAEGDEGVVGGVIGGEVPEEAPRGPQIEDAPRWYTEGFRRPVEASPGCVAAAIRLPPDLAGFVSERLSVKFAVGRDGRVGEVVFLANVPDRRIEAAVVAALRSCAWRPGADGRGLPIALWVILPIRFAGD